MARSTSFSIYLVTVFAVIGCGGGGGSTPDATALDVPDPGNPGDIAADPGVDPVTDAGLDPGGPDLPDVPKPLEKRHFTNRVIGGASMGAMALTVAAHRPGRFDVVGALGGYVDFRYIHHFVRDLMLGGFCPMDQILAHLPDINDPTKPGVFCGPVKPTMPYEHEWDFNHMYHDGNGGDWRRDFYLDVLESLSFAFGNFLYHNPDHPLLPPGVPVSWLELPDAEKCDKPARVGKPHNFNAEYNPKGEYDLITFCDGNNPVGCKDGNPDLCGKDNPDFFKLAGWYDPAYKHKRPVIVMLAVDYNQNGLRDYGEPVVVNAVERFRDVGTDGCGDAYEDGKGGCLDKASSGGPTDPNHDDFDLESNPAGTEGNGEYDPGEPFDDFGLDGVPETVSGFKDFGEGNGVWDVAPNAKAAFDQDARSFFATAPIDEIRKQAYYFDGGIRDALHSLTSTMHITNALKARGEPLAVYDDFVQLPTSIFPGIACEDLILRIDEKDFSTGAFGRNVLLRYGNPNATPAQIADGDGMHVGTACQVILRLLVYYNLAIRRLPDPILVNDGDVAPNLVFTSYYSEALKSRRWIGVNEPPGYDAPENQNLRYPMAILLPGVGMPTLETLEATILMSALMGEGKIPRYLILVPDGQCCHVRRSTGERTCGCLRYPDGYHCLERDCKGPHESCKEEIVPGSDLVQECNSGHFFVNQKTDRWGHGDAESIARMRHEDALFEVLEYAEQHWRVRSEQDVLVPEGY